MSSTISHYQNLNLFIISSISTIACISYNIENNSEYIFSLLQRIILLYLSIDIFCTKQTDAFIHHICSLLIGFYDYYYKIDYIDNNIITYYIYKTEITSIFLVLKHYIKKDSIFYNINNLIFVILFFKFRLFDYYYYIIERSSSLYIIPGNDEISIRSAVIYTGVYGLYFINVYWGLLMIKIIYKSIKPFIDSSYKFCHYLSSYIHVINVPVAIYIYSYNIHEKNIFNLVGLSVLTMSCYFYHYDVYNRFNKNEIIEYIYPKNNSLLFVNDIISIHIRSFLVLLTSYYDNKYMGFVLTNSFLLHLISIYFIIRNILYCVTTNNNYKKEQFFTVSNTVSMISIVPDIMLIFINSNMEYGIPFLIVNITLILLLLIEPLYELNHFGFHILLLFQNYYLCMIHNSS